MFNTVNVVIFAGGKFCEMLARPSRGDNFHNILHISVIKSYGFYFPAGEIFVKKVISRKKAKITPTRKFPRLQ